MYRTVVPRTFQSKQRVLIQYADEICKDYAQQGYSLTLRQLYYQFVSRGIIPNNDKQYANLGNLISNARRAGLIDWNHINDRTRYLRTTSFWDDASHIIDNAARGFRLDLWTTTDQEFRPEVWVEKDALVDVVARACEQFRVPYMSCRGYPSDSVMWETAQRIKAHYRAGYTPTIIHLGDHDPSGLDMSRDLDERLELFGGAVDVRRIALSMDQVQQYQPPPNPAKVTDSRYQNYVEEWGHESWELDALSPEVINNLIRNEIATVVDETAWNRGLAQEAEIKAQMTRVAARWDDISNNWDNVETLLEELS